MKWLHPFDDWKALFFSTDSNKGLQLVIFRYAITFKNAIFFIDSPSYMFKIT